MLAAAISLECFSLGLRMTVLVFWRQRRCSRLAGPVVSLRFISLHFYHWARVNGKWQHYKVIHF